MYVPLEDLDGSPIGLRHYNTTSCEQPTLRDDTQQCFNESVHASWWASWGERIWRHVDFEAELQKDEWKEDRLRWLLKEEK